MARKHEETGVAKRSEAQPPSAGRSMSMFDDFYKEMDNLLGSFFGTRTPAPRAWTSLPAGIVTPAIDVSENDKEITLTAELPGLSEEDVELVVQDGRMTLKGEKRHEEDREEEDYHVSERSYGSFQRSMPIPDRVDVDKVKASFDKGVLKVKMPKKPEAETKGRKIDIGK